MPLYLSHATIQSYVSWLHQARSRGMQCHASPPLSSRAGIMMMTPNERFYLRYDSTQHTGHSVSIKHKLSLQQPRQHTRCIHQQGHSFSVVLRVPSAISLDKHPVPIVKMLLQLSKLFRIHFAHTNSSSLSYIKKGSGLRLQLRRQI
jgi:hypothetical protein